MTPPHALMAEYTPGVAERHRRWGMMPKYARSLAALREAGYRLFHLGGINLVDDQRSPRHPLGCLVRKATVKGCDWHALPLSPLREIGEVAVRAEELNAEKMAADTRNKSFHVPWDLHPQSLHAEFTHNTDLLGVNVRGAVGHAEIPHEGEVGVRATSGFGLGGGSCADIMRDSPMLEVVGRLCMPQGRQAAITEAIARAEHPRTYAVSRAVHDARKAQADAWQFTGPCHFAVEPKRGPGPRPGGPIVTANGLATCALRNTIQGIGVTTTAVGHSMLGARILSLRANAAAACPLLRLNGTIVRVNGTLLPPGARVEDVLFPTAGCVELSIGHLDEESLSPPPTAAPPPPLPTFLSAATRMPLPPRSTLLSREGHFPSEHSRAPAHFVGPIHGPIAIALLIVLCLLTRRRRHFARVLGTRRGHKV
jgi:hypothetical protein